ncbi:MULTISPECIES: hypothetical protein [Corynebacterium]|uniref:HK97 gp10 family phage protein n=1 Tax=Corynebacterium ihumii TaxID=1232427 RepID=A0ABY7UD61_9CORY|nr:MULTISPECIES: hypothetical protein [Corynebacterium]WCZ33658.1 hypothetical protein CIHUM_01050 [Corynebacterium ihumii]
MTTSRAVHHRDPAAFREFMKSPEIEARVQAAAASIVKKMQAAWPEGADTPTKDGVEKVFEVRDFEMADGRPTTWVFVNHPYAAAHEATTGFVTKSISASGYRIRS